MLALKTFVRGGGRVSVREAGTIMDSDRRGKGEGKEVREHYPVDFQNGGGELS